MTIVIKRRKQCTKCGEWKTLDVFHRHGRTKDGRHPRCKPCRIADEEDRRRKAGCSKKEIHYCKVKKCDTKVKGFGYCEKHLDRLRRHGSVKLKYPPLKIDKDGTALCKGCARRLLAKSFRKKIGGKDVYQTLCGTCRNHQRRRYVTKTEAFNRIDVFERDQWICHLCDTLIDAARIWPDLWSASVDHVIPLAYGGKDTFDNVRAAHLTCNCRRQDRLLEEVTSDVR